MKSILAALIYFASFSAFAITDKVVVTGMDRPWAVVAGPDQNIWITEKRSGKIRIYNTKFEALKTLRNLPDLASYVEGGLLDLAFHPRFKQTNWIYLSYTVKAGNAYKVQINRFTYRDGKLQDRKILIEGPLSTAGHHYGSRLLFDDQGYLLATLGERLEKEKAQVLSEMNGKIVRITDEGRIPSDNPFGPQSPVYSLGHRNPQGLAMHPISRRIYDSEHGPSGFEDKGFGGDEINEVKQGANYGWPLYHHRMKGPGMTEPIQEYEDAIAPSGIAFYTGDAISEWKNDLFVAALKGQKIVRIRIGNDGRLNQPDEFLLENKYGRLRDVETSPDGSLLVLAEDGRLIQLK